MSKTLAAHILNPIWKIEPDAVRRPLVVFGVGAVVALRLIGIALSPLLIAILAALTLVSGTIRFIRDLPGQFIATWRAEFRAWAELRSGVPKVWETSHARRYVPTLIVRNRDAEPQAVAS